MSVLYDMPVTNRGFETGSMSGWSFNAGTPLPGTTSPHSGTNKARMGNVAGAAGVWGGYYQDMTLPLHVASLNQHGACTVDLSMWMDDFSGDNDGQRLRIGVYNGSGEVVQFMNKEFQFTFNGTWTQQTKNEPLHPAAKWIRISADGQRVTGTENSAYSDDWEIAINSSGTFRYDVGLLNVAGADGITNWTVTSGSLAIRSAFSQSFDLVAPSSTYFYSANTSAFVAEQTVTLAISYGLDTALDTGGLTFHLKYMQGSWAAGNDEARMYIEYLDGADALVGSVHHVSTVALKQWQARELSDVIPALTRKIKFVMEGTRLSGTACDGYLTAIQGYIDVNSNFIDGINSVPWPAEPVSGSIRNFPSQDARAYPITGQRAFPQITTLTAVAAINVNTVSYENVVFHSHFDGADAATSAPDESHSGHVMTFVANAQLDTAVKAFGTASLLLDGTGDVVTVPDSDDFNFGSGAFTIEFRATWNTDPADFQNIIGQWETVSNLRSWAIVRDQPGGQLEFWTSVDGTAFVLYPANWSPVLDQEYAIAADYDGTHLRLYVDGKVIVAAHVVLSLFDSTALMTIGAKEDGTREFDGWIDEVIITKGFAKFRGDYTVPSALVQPVDADFGSVVLLNHYEGDDADTDVLDRSGNGFTGVFAGNAQIDKARSKFGGSSLLLDGVGDALKYNDNADFSFGAGDFTIDLQANPTSVNTGMMILSKYDSSAVTAEWYLYYDQAANQLTALFYYGTGANSQFNFSGSWDLLQDTWHQLAVERHNDTWRIYAEGLVVASHAVSRTLKDSTQSLWIGGRNHSSNLYFHGSIDELRITKGVARYQGSHDLQTEPWPNE